MDESAGTPGNDTPAPTQDTAVIGVVIAGLLSAFLVPGPFDLGSMLIGLLLLVVLGAYADWTPRSFGRALGTAAAGGFATLYAAGHWIDVWMPLGGDHHWLSGWPEKEEQTLDDFSPDVNGGLSLLLTWLVFSGCFLGVLLHRNQAPRHQLSKWLTARKNSLRLPRRAIGPAADDESNRRT
jgi:hypothetical protein